MAEEESKEAAKTDAELWLEGIGLPAASMDPSSLTALSDLLSGQHVDFNDPLQQHHSDSSSSRKTPSTQVNNALHRDNLEACGDRKVSADDEAEEEDETSIAIPEEASAVERLILGKLNQQTKLLKKLEKRLDRLQRDTINGPAPRSRTSDQELEQITTGFIRNSHPSQQRMPEIPPRDNIEERERELNGVIRQLNQFREPGNRLPEQVRPPQVAPIRAGPPPHRADNGMGASRVYKCIVLFLALRRHQVPNDRIDGWMLVKIMFMLSILLSKDQGKLFTTLTVVVLGFLWQSGLAGFIYKFVFRYNYVGRILLHNEDITVQSALAEQPTPPRMNAPARGGGGGEAQLQQQQQQRQWWHVDPERPAIYNTLMDIVMLFGSLFLSIFPMWRVPDPPTPPPAEAEQQHNDAQDGMIPVVRPPVDPAAADSDDEQGEDAGNE